MDFVSILSEHPLDATDSKYLYLTLAQSESKFLYRHPTYNELGHTGAVGGPKEGMAPMPSGSASVECTCTPVVYISETTGPIKLSFVVRAIVHWWGELIGQGQEWSFSRKAGGTKFDGDRLLCKEN